MKFLNPAPWSALLVLLSIAATVPPAHASPCEAGVYCNVNDPGTYRVTFSVTSTTPVAITGLVDLWGGSHAADQGDFLLGNPPGLPTGSGTLDAGIWAGEDAHFLLGMAGTHLVVLMNPATAALMVGQPFDNLVNGIPPLTVPNPFPVTNAEALIIDRITNRPAEWSNDVWSLFDPLYRPNALDPTVLIGPGATTGVLMSFTDGKILGTVEIKATAVPEPGAWALVLVGSFVLLAWARRLRP